MNTKKIAFWTYGTPVNSVTADFGCSVHGFANSRTWANPGEALVSAWDMELPGEVLAGSYRSVLDGIRGLGFRPGACIVIFTRPAGMESFIDSLARAIPGVPLIGGGAAVPEGYIEGDVIPAGQEVILMAAASVDLEVESLNIYDTYDLEVEIRNPSPREIGYIRTGPDGDWQGAAEFFRDLQAKYGLNPGNFETMTFSDSHGRNIHLSISGKSIHTGANLPSDKKLFLRALPDTRATERLSAFLSGNNSLIFACAGIRSLIKTPLRTGTHSLAGFMFGELVMLDGKPLFGNLMLTRLKKKN